MMNRIHSVTGKVHLLLFYNARRKIKSLRRQRITPQSRSHSSFMNVLTKICFLSREVGSENKCFSNKKMDGDRSRGQRGPPLVIAQRELSRTRKEKEVSI